MKREKYTSTTRFKFLVFFICIFIGLILAETSTEGTASLPAKIFGAVTAPVQSISSAVTNGVHSLIKSFETTDNLKKQLAEKDAEIKELKDKTVEYDAMKSENIELKKALNLKEQNPDYDFVTASVIARDPSERYYSFTIDKGTLSDISLNDPVITPEGLIGCIYEIGPTYSKVKTILNINTNVGALLSRTQDTGILSGSVELAQDGFCKLSYLTRGTKAIAGDFVVTSGIGGVYPKGLQIGTVLEIKTETDGISEYALINPATDSRKVRDVMIITAFEGQGVGTDIPDAPVDPDSLASEPEQSDPVSSADTDNSGDQTPDPDSGE